VMLSKPEGLSCYNTYAVQLIKYQYQSISTKCVFIIQLVNYHSWDPFDKLPRLQSVSALASVSLLSCKTHWLCSHYAWL